MATHLAAAAAAAVAEIICPDIWLLGVQRVSVLFGEVVLRRVIVCVAAQVTTKSIDVAHSVQFCLHEQGFTLTFVFFWPLQRIGPLYFWSCFVPLMNIFCNIKCQISLFMVGKNFFFSAHVMCFSTIQSHAETR